jgi:sulfate adenylyltransferase
MPSQRPVNGKGFCIWLTGLPSAGKSPIADVLVQLLTGAGRTLTVLDGDVVRTHLSADSGLAARTVIPTSPVSALVASEIVRHEGGVICAVVGPYDAAGNWFVASCRMRKFANDACEGSIR